MCQKMMEQRTYIKNMIDKAVEECIKKIRDTGIYDAPTVMVDLSDLFKANLKYFEQEGFFFEPNTRIENNQVKFYAWIKFFSEGNMGRKFWKEVEEAKQYFSKRQRNNIIEALKNSENGKICICLNEILFENMIFFQERGYIFVPDVTKNTNQRYMVWMEKRRR